MNREAFVVRYGGVYEHSPWVAERAWDGGAEEGSELAGILCRVVERAGRERQLALLRAHPDLAGRLGTALTPESAAEQADAGLDRCTPQEFAEFTTLNERYTARFGFPFIIAVKGLDRQAILSAFRRRVDGEPEVEFRTALDEVHTFAAFRLAALDAPPEVAREEIEPAELEALALSALLAAGADEANARAIAATVLAAERDGSESHGVFRLPGYVAGLAKGTLNGRAAPRILDGPDGAVIVDGDGGAAPTAYALALPRLADVAARRGVAVLCLRNAVHFAALWHEVEWLAERGLAAFACTANFPYLAPHGGRRAFGTNPLAFAFPRAGGPVAFDFAAAAMARGDIMIAARDGRRVPDGIGLDADGRPTNDPAAILQGAQLAFGGRHGMHKGSLIALMVELLAAGVVGDVFSDEAAARMDETGLPRGGVLVLALSPERLGGPGAPERAAAFLARLAAEPGVRLPGARRHARRAAGGPLEVEAELLATIRRLAGE